MALQSFERSEYFQVPQLDALVGRTARQHRALRVERYAPNLARMPSQSLLVLSALVVPKANGRVFRGCGHN